MTSRRLLISLSLVLLAWQTAEAQLAPAADFFNSGAQLYISNNIPAALERVETGLKTYPNDEKLKKLEQLLKQQQQQQQQQQNEQNQKDQQQQSSKDQQNQKPQDQSQQQKSEDQQKQDQQKAEDQKKADQKKDDQKKASPEKKEGEQPKDQQGEGQPVAPGQMTPEEAKRLLDAQKGDEQVLPLKPDGKPRDPRKPVKDW